MIMNGNRPTLISGVPKPALSLAMIRSQARAIPSAPASTWPLAATIDGLPSSPSSMNTCGKSAVPRYLWAVGASAAKPPRLPPAENTFSCEEASTTTRTASSAFAARSASSSSAQQLVGERVARLRVVERDRRDVLGDLVADLLVAGQE